MTRFVLFVNLIFMHMFNNPFPIVPIYFVFYAELCTGRILYVIRDRMQQKEAHMVLFKVHSMVSYLITDNNCSENIFLGIILYLNFFPNFCKQLLF